MPNRTVRPNLASLDHRPPVEAMIPVQAVVATAQEAAVTAHPQAVADVKSTYQTFVA